MVIDVNWSPGMKLADVEKLVILKAFNFYGKNKTQTARVLDIAVRTLDAKLLQYEGGKENEREVGSNATDRGVHMESPPRHAKEPAVSMRKR